MDWLASPSAFTRASEANTFGLVGSAVKCGSRGLMGSGTLNAPGSCYRPISSTFVSILIVPSKFRARMVNHGLVTIQDDFSAYTFLSGFRVCSLQPDL
jgi:hypothetical protein